MTPVEIYIYVLLIILVGVIVIAFVAFKMIYKHRVIIKEITNNKKIIKFYSARQYINKDGVGWWRLWGKTGHNTRLIPIPPPEVIEINSKGKQIVECYQFPTGEVVWIHDAGKVEDPPYDLFNEVEENFMNLTIETAAEQFKDFPNDINSISDEDEKQKAFNLWRDTSLNDYKKATYEAWRRDNHIVKPLDTVSTSQRQIIVNNIKKAEERKKKTFKEMLPQVMAIGGLIVIIVALFVFWGDIAKPVIEARQIGLQEQEINKQIVQGLNDLNNNVQRIEAQQVELTQAIETIKSNK